MGERNLSRGFLGCPPHCLCLYLCVHFDSSAVGSWYNVFSSSLKSQLMLKLVTLKSYLFLTL
ncbi:hypothetical protein HOLleu_44623 [Holothuria leucospilota]|uniref:Uncharacterized protein n=1 Tax=Holothuria leucospilota TaxID=206669 RepID=A0A9Q1BAB8_HOLLE|nr:hypothetical protein HOLleu_44623 [Holothuria leucospilota]